MNAQRRKAIAALIVVLNGAEGIAEEVATDEREYADNMPEGLQESERGQKAQEDADNLESALDSIREAVEYLSGIEA